MMDEADIAQAQMEEEARLQALVKSRKPVVATIFTNCTDCDDELPSVRRHHGFSKCLSCAQADEIRNKFQGQQRGFS